MKFSLSSFIYFNYPLSEAISRIAAAGYKGIDIWGGRPHAYRQDLTEKDIINLRSILRDVDLRVSSFIPAQFRYPSSLCSPADVIRNDSVRYIQDSIETASALGAPIVSVCPGHTLYGQSKEDGLQRLSESLWEISEFASRHQIEIAIEPADRYETDLLNNCAEALAFTDKLNFQNLGVLLDTGHEYIAGATLSESVRNLGEKLFHVHVDDNNGQRDQHLVPGEGSIHFQDFFAALLEANYDGFLGAELGWDYTLDPDPAAFKTIEWLNRFLHIKS
jgi:protein FrlC